MTDLSCKLLVVGAGPGGYVCAIRAGQLGIDTMVVEADRFGGTCLNVGCIPSKALIHAADEFHKLTAFAENMAMGISASSPSINFARTIEWKDGIVARLNGGVGALLKKAKVRTVHGTARFLDGKTVSVTSADGERRIRAESIVIATGSAPVELPLMPFGGNVISSTEALALADVPGRLAVVGGGYIGLEIGTALAKLGSTVTVVEAESEILPQYDAELTRPVVKRLAALGIDVMTGSRAIGLSGEALEIESGAGDKTSIVVDTVLVSVGRRPRTKGVGLEELSLTMADQFVHIDDRCQTSMRGVYAIGDVTGEPMLAHRAMHQGEMVAENTIDADRITTFCPDQDLKWVYRLPDGSHRMNCIELGKEAYLSR